MKNKYLLITILLLASRLFTVSAYSQNTTRFYLSKGTPMYRDTTDLSSGITLQNETPIDVIKYRSNRKGYFKTADNYYYVHSYYLIPQVTQSTNAPIASNHLEDAPNGAAGLKFGMSPNEVKALWSTKGKLSEAYTPLQAAVGSILFKNLKVGTETFDIAVVKFVNMKLYDIILSKIPYSDGFAQDIYDNLQEILITKYGNGSSIRHFEGIYEDGDGYEMQAVKLGEATIATYWDFSPISIIKLGIESAEVNLIVIMQYQSVELCKEVNKATNKANKIEF